MKQSKALNLIKKQLARARNKFDDFHGPHEGYAVIKEELDELWDDVKQDNVENACKEAAEVAACAIRFMMDLEPK